jgi:hypothetical protein
MLARTAAERRAFTWLNINTYAVCSSDIPISRAIAPNRGPRWAETAGRSFDDADDEERKRPENSFSTSDVVVVQGLAGRAVLKDRSHIESRARPWATDARRPTVQMMAASRASSRSTRSVGLRWAARTKGSVVEAYDDRDNSKKAGKEEARRQCARYDSRPLLNAKEPSGSAESARSRRKWFDADPAGPERVSEERGNSRLLAVIDAYQDSGGSGSW